MKCFSNIKTARASLGAVLAAFLFSGVLFSPLAFAQNSLSISVTPPLFRLTIEPGEFWSSSLKAVNTNSYDLELLVLVMDFAARGEDGHGAFTPVPEGSGPLPHSLASWITVDESRITVPAGESTQVTFSVRVPENAEPGGHSAALLVGTAPVEGAGGQLVNVSSFVSSLLFVRLGGDVREEGIIREFRSRQRFYQKPEADFVLRFQNRGNVHLLPQGNIVIYNMWGKKRGEIEINQGTRSFGNVLPESTRSFEFSWLGEYSPLEIGRYSAVATTSFGEDARQNASATTYFWIVPLRPLISGLAILVSFGVLLTIFIRAYVRRSLQLQAHLLGLTEHEHESEATAPQRRHSLNPTLLLQPLKESVVDLRSIQLTERHHRVAQVPAQSRQRISLSSFVKKYRTAFVFVVVIGLGIIGLLGYFTEVLTHERDYNVRVKETENSVGVLETR